MSVEPVTKVCSRCGKRLPLAKFHRQKAGKHGRRADCIACGKATREERGTTSQSYNRALRRLRDAYPRDFAAFLAEERGHNWEPSPCPDSADYWRGRWADTACALVDALGGERPGEPTPSDIVVALTTIEECRATHVAWLDYLARWGDDLREHEEIAGDAGHHREIIDRYDHVLAVLRCRAVDFGDSEGGTQ